MAKVIKGFSDSKDGLKVYNKGSEYVGDREQELMKLGYLEQPKEDKRRKVKTEKK